MIDRKDSIDTLIRLSKNSVQGIGHFFVVLNDIDMKYYMLTYLLVNDYMDRRGDFRKVHLALADEYYKKGVLLMGGALTRPSDKAVLIFRAEGVKVVEDFVKDDPYVKNGLVASWEVREWNVVVGLV